MDQTTTDVRARRDEMMGHLARKQYVRVAVDVNAPAVRVPDAVRASADNGVIVLEYGPNELLRVPIPDLDVGEHGIAATLTFDARPAKTFIPWPAVRGIMAVPPREPQCALCARRRAQVPQLVAGDAGAVCDECLATALAFLDSTPHVPRWGFVHVTLGRVLASLPPTTPLDETRPLLLAAFALAGDAAPAAVHTAREALRLGHDQLAADALSALPPAAHGPTSLHALARAWLALDRVAEARAAFAAIDAAALDDAGRATITVDRAAVAAAPGGDPAGGDPAGAGAALSALSTLEASAGTDALRLRALGDALAATGRAGEAPARWRQALEVAAPHGPLAASLRARLEAVR